MTVQYNHLLAEASFANFFSLLFRWRGSVYKLIWKELLFYLFLFYVLLFVYRYALTPNGARVFEMAVIYCKTMNYTATYLTFLLGFYVTIVFRRWKTQFQSIPWPDTVTLMMIAYLYGSDDRSRLMRRTIVRYLNLGYALTMRSISPPVKKRFPTLHHMTVAGLMLPNEELILEKIKTPYNKYLIPIVWAMSLLMRARREKRVVSDPGICQLFFEIDKYRENLNNLFLMDCVSIPIVYTQVVALCTYTYFAFLLMSEQFIDTTASSSTQYALIYFPVGLALEFIFYIGWLKVAEVIINPFGEDDDDFDVNMYIDRNFTNCYLLVDEGGKKLPPFVRDDNWGIMYYALPWSYPGPLRRRRTKANNKCDDRDEADDGQLPSPIIIVDEKESEEHMVTKTTGMLPSKTRSQTIDNALPQYKTSHPIHTPFDNRFEDVKNVVMQPEPSDASFLTLATNEMRRIVHSNPFTGTNPFAVRLRDSQPHDERRAHEVDDDDDDDDVISDDEREKSKPHKPRE